MDRRSAEEALPVRTFELGSTRVDLDRRHLERGGRIVGLSANEAGLLAVLAEHAGKPVDRDQLLLQGLGYRRPLKTRAIDQAIWRLRKKIEDEPTRPVFLLSEAHHGYRLVFAPPPDGALYGREAELDQLRRWVADGARDLLLVGPPGIGREALAQRVRAPDVSVRVATRMAAGPNTLRVGPLPDDAAIALLTDRILRERGTASLTDAERDALPRLVRAAGGHPGALVHAARRSVVEGLGGLVPADPALARFAEALEPGLAEIAVALAQVPDPFTAEEVEPLVGSSALERAWRGCAVEAVGGDPERRFVVLPGLARALAARGFAPSAEVRAAYVAAVARSTDAPVAEALVTGRQSAIHAVRDRRVRLLSRAAAGDSGALVGLLVALDEPDEATCRIVEAVAPADADARASRAVVLSRGRERDRDAWTAWIGEAWRTACSPGVRIAVCRATARFRMYTEADPRAMDEVVEAAGELHEAGVPLARPTYFHLRGVASLRAGRIDAGTDDLVEAVGCYRKLGATGFARSVLSNLASAALRDGRIDEGIAWAEEGFELVHRARLGESADDEAHERLRLAELFLAAGRPTDAEEQLLLAEVLGTRAVGARATSIAVARASCELQRGHVHRAAVQLRQLRGGLPDPGAPLRGVDLLDAWCALLTGDAEGALRSAEVLAADPSPLPIDRLHLAFVHALVLACLGDPERGRVVAVEAAGAFPRPPRWWAGAELLLEAAFALASGGELDDAELKRRLRRIDAGHPMFPSALAHLARRR